MGGASQHRKRPNKTGSNRRIFFNIAGVLLIMAGALAFGAWDAGWFSHLFRPPQRQSAPVEPAPVKQPSLLTISATGDIMLARGVASAIARQGRFYPFQEMSGLIKEADLAFGNLECSLSARGTPLVGKGIWFRGDPAGAADLKKAGYDLISVANNHSLDYDTPAFLDTLAVLKAQGIEPVGGGENATAAAQAVIKDYHGYRVACLAATEMADIYWDVKTKRTLEAKPNQAGVLRLDPDQLVSAVRSIKGKADLIMISLHWGTEYSDEPTPAQRETAHRLIDAGASLILGTHPHCLQGVEIYHRGVIAYSLGNFVYDRQTRPKSQEGILLRLTYNKGGFRQVVLHPYLIADGQPRPAVGNDAARILERAARLSQELDTAVRVDGDTGRLLLK